MAAERSALRGRNLCVTVDRLNGDTLWELRRNGESRVFVFFSDSNEVVVCEQLLIFLDLSFHRVRFIEREIRPKQFSEKKLSFVGSSLIETLPNDLGSE